MRGGVGPAACVDLPPAQVWAQLLDAGRVPPCSIRTMYRVLAANQEVRERRNQLRHPVYQKPELLATGPNQVWSWDIAKLLGPVKWTYFYLYVLLDIFSRYVVGWLLARQFRVEDTPEVARTPAMFRMFRVPMTRIAVRVNGNPHDGDLQRHGFVIGFQINDSDKNGLMAAIQEDRDGLPLPTRHGVVVQVLRQWEANSGEHRHREGEGGRAFPQG
jgi:integrase-like protein